MKPPMPPLLWTAIDATADGPTISVRGELSGRTAAALGSLVDVLLAGDQHVVLDLRDVTTIPPALQLLLDRWSPDLEAEGDRLRLRRPIRTDRS